MNRTQTLVFVEHEGISARVRLDAVRGNPDLVGDAEERLEADALLARRVCRSGLGAWPDLADGLDVTFAESLLVVVQSEVLVECESQSRFSSFGV